LNTKLSQVVEDAVALVVMILWVLVVVVLAGF
jgi:hypothetical protein